MDENKYPRVLIVNAESLNQKSATGLTLCCLFKEWPKNRLACVHTGSTKPDLSYCNTNWFLGQENLSWAKWFCRGDRRAFPRDSQKPEASTDSSSLLQNTNKTAFLKTLRKKIAGQSLRDLCHFHIPDHIQNEIAAFQPQVIYSLLGSNPIQQLALELARLYDVPIVPHFMDDWMPHQYKSSVFRVLLRKRMWAQFNKILEHTTCCMAIGDAMAEEYRHRYKKDFYPFMNAVEPELLEQPDSPPPEHRVIRLVYAGGLHLNRWKSLLEIGSALQSLREEGIAAELIIYTHPKFAQEAKKLNLPPVMQCAGSVKASEVFSIIQDADIVVHVESFDKKYVEKTRYSVSTKIPECMAAKRPIVAYGPEELASIKYIRESQTGICITKRNKSHLVNQLREILKSKELRNRFVKQGIYIASRRHNAAQQRMEFHNTLVKSVALFTQQKHTG